MPILLLMSSIIFGQVEAENNKIIVPKETFKQIRIELNNYESLKQTMLQKDLEIKQLEIKVVKLEAIELSNKDKIKLLSEKVNELKPTFWDSVKDYGFVIGLIVGVFISK